ncbi:Siderophore-interacting protein [Beutenbergia cavernae DSM 12333]|uniref:Siderophore-interacting protein n=1 Tax=Beutenbergia cavernae (strain ATCC BAA-8 / DSM 12333 / CCUG 43141 / JCM 11478 / NBRC 16432 / NCIMB 13614 / HKI 0122) TaxID=471853 RepID=C5C1G3_BEUC1|nr:siderophore-interacting protein [Beutenbergia cavernae]ACQ81573.1 Siderophore-interacting protein [Beutenbergia cavernae DSM 12333]
MPFERATARHPLAVRRVHVHAVRDLTPTVRRVTFRDGSPDLPPLATMVADGPEDHVKVFFPDPVTGELHAPSITADGGLQRAVGGVSISRDYTVRSLRPGDEVGDDGVETPGYVLDVDVLLHGDEGPASAWAARASAGDELAIAGPRGSVLAPDGIARLVVVADETALPAAARWVAAVGPDVPVTAILDVADESVEPYGAELGHASIEWLYREDGPGQVLDAVRSLGPLAPEDVVFAAGEATTLVPVRAYLRHEAGARADQLSVSGYWKRGVVNLDHHEPLDPSDPD